MSKSWEGTVSVRVEGTFVYEVDESWGCESPADAIQEIDRNLSTYLGPAYVEDRLKDHWTVHEMPEEEAEVRHS